MFTPTINSLRGCTDCDYLMDEIPTFKFTSDDVQEVIDTLRKILTEVPTVTREEEARIDVRNMPNVYLHNLMFGDIRYQDDSFKNLLYLLCRFINTTTSPDCIQRGIDGAIKYMGGRIISINYVGRMIIRNLAYMVEYEPTYENGRVRGNAGTYYHQVSTVIAFAIVTYLVLLNKCGPYRNEPAHPFYATNPSNDEVDYDNDDD